MTGLIDGPLSPEGEIVMRAIGVLAQHLETHNCPECKHTCETALSAITEWLNSQNKEEKNGKESKTEGEGEKPAKEGEPGGSQKKPSWDIF